MVQIMPRSYKATGFTIVELLIVIVVIAILAAIVIVAYNGITKQATEASMQSDLREAATRLELDKTKNGAYPADAAAADGGKGLSTSGQNVLSYRGGGTASSYCINITSPNTSSTYYLSSSDNQIKDGLCDAWVTTFATSPMFSTPIGIVTDPSGTVYMVDPNSYRIYRVTSAGVISVFAGSGVLGVANGTGTAAQFNGPHGIAIDPSGNLYVTDRGSHRIRKVTPAGVVSTFAGSSQGYAEGTGTAAAFNSPYGIVADASGNVYVGDAGNHRIRKITPAGVVSTFAGSGVAGATNATGTAAQFDYPSGLAIDSSGVIYVADNNNNRIRKISPAGVVTTLAGSTEGYVNGTGTGAQFAWPYGVAVDASGTVYVADSGNNRIRKITPAGVVTTLAGNGEYDVIDGAGSSAQFVEPYGITATTDGVVYVADTYGNVIRKIVQ